MGVPDAIPGRSIILAIKTLARLYQKYGRTLDPVFSTPVKEAIVTLIVALPDMEDAVNPRGPG